MDFFCFQTVCATKARKAIICYCLPRLCCNDKFGTAPEQAGESGAVAADKFAADRHGPAFHVRAQDAL